MRQQTAPNAVYASRIVKARKLKFRYKRIYATDERTGKLQFQQKYLRYVKRDDRRSAYEV